MTFQTTCNADEHALSQAGAWRLLLPAIFAQTHGSDGRA